MFTAAKFAAVNARRKTTRRQHRCEVRQDFPRFVARVGLTDFGRNRVTPRGVGGRNRGRFATFNVTLGRL